MILIKFEYLCDPEIDNNTYQREFTIDSINNDMTVNITESEFNCIQNLGIVNLFEIEYNIKKIQWAKNVKDGSYWVFYIKNTNDQIDTLWDEDLPF